MKSRNKPLQIVQLFHVEASEQHREERTEGRRESGERADERAKYHDPSHGERDEDYGEGHAEVFEVLARHSQRLGELTDVFVEPEQAQELDVDEKDDSSHDVG